MWCHLCDILTGSALPEAESVKKTLDMWQIAEKIIASAFDVTSPNTGVHKGCCILLKDLIGRQFLWLACRHHILELILKATLTEFFGNTTGPEETFFKAFLVLLGSQ